MDLSQNKIKNKGAKALASVLKRSQILQWLDLGYNEITDKGIIVLAEALKTNQTLQYLNLNENLFDLEGTQALEKMLTTNYTLQELVLWASYYSEAPDKDLDKRMNDLLSANKRSATIFKKRTDAIKSFIASHRGQPVVEDKDFQKQMHLRQRKIEALIPLLEKIHRGVGRDPLNDEYKRKLEVITQELTQSLYGLLLNPLHQELMNLPFEDIREGGDFALAENLCKIWVKFFGYKYPQWLIKLKSSLKEEVLRLFQSMIARAGGKNMPPSADSEPIDPLALFDWVCTISTDFSS